MLKHTSRKLRGAVLLLLLFALFFSIIMSINIGVVSINVKTTFAVIVNHISGTDLFPITWQQTDDVIIWQLRAPRVLSACIVGAGLSVAGIFMQALTKNVLADPYILGISSGASTGAVVSILLGVLPFVGKIYLPIAAFAGALLSSFLVFIIGGRTVRMTTTRLVLGGMAISALFSALTDFIIFLTPGSRQLENAIFWMTGSFANCSWKDIPVIFGAMCVGIVAAYLMGTALDAMLMGESMAQGFGVEVNTVKAIIILISTLITACMVSVSGIIGFVGLIIPHITRSLTGASHRRMLPFAVLFGAIFMEWADVIARIIIDPREMPVGVITSLVGVPFFVFILRKSRYQFNE